MNIGKRIAATRKLRGLSQFELGTACGYGPQVAKQRISHYEGGNRAPKLGDIRRMATVLGVDPGWIAFGTEAGEHLEPDERALLEIWRRADPEIKAGIQALFSRLAEGQPETPTPPFASGLTLIALPGRND